jgi:hypothetical protein
MLSELTVPDLKSKSKDLGIKGFGSMNKQELVDAIDKALATSHPLSEHLHGDNQSSNENNHYANLPKFHKFNAKGAK